VQHSGGIVERIVRPPVVGAAYLLALAMSAGLSGDMGGEDLGARAGEITAFVEGRFGGDISSMGTAIGAAAIVIGALLGFASGLLVRLRDRMARLPSRSPRSLAIRSFVVVVVLHATFEAHAMARAPQLYAGAFYARGGLLRTIQVVVTDVLGTSGVVLVATLLLALFLAGPRAQWSRWPGRLRRAFLPAAVATAVAAVVANAEKLPRIAEIPTAIAAPAPEPASSAPAPAPASTRRPNILILAADSLRADRLEPRTMPRLTSLAAAGARFDRTYVSLPRTFPSWVTLLTGRHPHHHGIRSMFPRWEERAKDFDALPSHLARAGWRTMVVSDYAGDIFGRVDLGWNDVAAPTFDFRELVRQRALERETPLLPFLHSHTGRKFFPVMRELNHAADPDMLADDAIALLDRAGAKGKDGKVAPFFMTVFFSTAHFPYAAPAPYYGKFTRPGYRGRFKYHKPVGLGQEAAPDDDDVAQVRALYDGAVLGIDDACGRILDALAKNGVADNTIVVVLADHGETLYDHGHGQGHGDHLFGDEGTHIPLVVYDPQRPASRGRRDVHVARDVDVAPTLYELAGVEPPADLDGRSLAPAMDGRTLPPAFAYAETDLWFTETIPALPPELRLPYPDISRVTEIDAAHGDELVLDSEVRPLTIVAKHRMVRDERFKLIYIPTRTGVKYMLYDTVTDPAETRDVASEHPAEVTRLQGELAAWMQRDPAMTMKSGYLVPRDTPSAPRGPPSPAAVRMGGK
jgi:arylsulfatase A-like enzyme